MTATPRTSRTPRIYLLSLLLLLLLMAVSHVLMESPFMGVVAFLAAGLVYLLFPARKAEDKFRDVASYKVFSRMTLYASLALNLGALMCICHLLLPGNGFALEPYLLAGAWILLIALVEWAVGRLLRRQRITLGFGSFLTGALIWIASDLLIFTAAATRFLFILWTFFWGVGLALVAAGLQYFSDAFEAVGALDGGLGREDLDRSNAAVQRVSAFISTLIMLAVVILWRLLPAQSGQLPLILRICEIQLPIIPMIAAVVAALNQPLDARSYEKLMNYLDRGNTDERVYESLKNLLLRKYRVHYLIRILSSIIRPFLRLKVSGEENLQRKNYPSVFVCNHSFIFGPISAVIYLPTYFRPWIHNVMLDRETVFVQMSFSFPKVPGKLLRIASNFTCRVLNACDPIPVVRGSTHEVMQTLELSLSALRDGDNLLIFPELPNNKTMDGESGADPKRLRSFYTGFAHIGQMYYESTGRSLLFYPIYSDRDRREFRIGEPVSYNPDLSPREGKAAIATELYKRMTELSS